MRNLKIKVEQLDDKEMRNLKTEVEELDDKEAVIKVTKREKEEKEEAVIKEQMESHSTASSVRKRPRISVQKQPKDTERERNSLGQVEFLERKLTGEAIHRNIELIWDRLTKSHACRLGIYGMGGVGKTTIMMHIHNRLVRDAGFDGVVFITVSQDFSIHKLQSDIGKALEIRDMEDEDQMKRAATLSQRLERKKNCVLILDDVWELLDLKEVGIPVEADGFKLVLTTRFYDVCLQMQCQEMIKIQPLSQGEAESLFLEELGSKVPPNLEIVKSIVQECAGLPIGVITMARSMLGATHVFEWRDASERLKESSMGQKDMEKVLKNLKFSYDRLGDRDVQQCFLSCALYPEDEWIDKCELIEFFIDQGLIGGLSRREEQNNRGLTILNKLRNVCLLEDDGSKMKMHDLIRDMALHIMGATSIVKAGKWLSGIPSEERWTDTLEKVSLMRNHLGEFPSNMAPNCPKLSTLLLNGCLCRNVAIPDSFFKNLLGLKVLNLSGNNVTELPNSISDLVNLRALLLRKCRKLRCIPDLGKLTSLRKLDANGCRSLGTLEGLEKLVNLRYLDLGKTLVVLKGTLEHLLNLQCLRYESIIHVDDVDDFNDCVRFIERSDNPLFYKLTMDRLTSDDSEDEDSEDSEYLQFKVQISDDARFGNLEREVDSDEEEQFGDLEREVEITDWDHAIVSAGRECTGIFILIPQDVQKMTMTNCGGMTNLSGMGPLKNLESLIILRCGNLRVLCGGQDEEVNDICDSPAPTPTPLPFPNLRYLRIWGCPELKYPFGHGFKSNLPHPLEIDIDICWGMEHYAAAAATSAPSLP